VNESQVRRILKITAIIVGILLVHGWLHSWDNIPQ
jgi:hypothetical protein